MLSREILDNLSVITEEEQQILDGREGINRNLYMERHTGNTVNYKKLFKTEQLIAVRPHTRFIAFPKHSHDFVEMVYQCTGQTVHIVNGNKIVLKQGEILILGQNARQEIMAAGKEDICVNFVILPEFFDNLFSLIGDEATPLKKFIIESLKNSGENSGYLYFEVSDILPIQNLTENLLWTNMHSIPNRRKIISFTMALLFMQLTRYTNRLGYQTPDEAAVMKMLRYVDKNYKSGSLRELADSLHYDFCWFSREIKRKTGKNYTQIVQEKRLSKACSLLANTDMNIEDISRYVGYDNISYFHRLFNKNYGMTPKRWRQLQCANKDTI